MAYSWDNRVKFVVRYMYDIDNNGYLDKNDFECLAVRTSVIESKGEVKPEKYEQNRKVMRNLWNEIADLADFNKDGQVSVEEFKSAVKNACVGKPFDAFPGALKAFISSHFGTVDVNGDGLVGVEEYRVDCCSRQAYSDIKEIDDAYNKLCSAEDKKKGGIDLKRFQELYAQFIGNPDETIGAVYLFGPLQELN
ncbi:sarcoplasmic calcium-binding protein 1-like isoform X3 [Amphibalanus amphitrite]|uniref:sarcoplasmic calcium-binding protein 1-like isoform X3 n=1 Tax=Amphibalanus amphitrite TaxID=1232801 RepID=UPI001C92B94F|nr:sarcoplasmic calcium-binding protein 1-like isoform X3 [Amphibalanus amphitrite]XP_043216113.1 sarcoplasmic calcium-binding protein 1-like isoform X3 [Amphibalanus amphitrite]